MNTVIIIAILSCIPAFEMGFRVGCACRQVTTRIVVVERKAEEADNDRQA